MLPFNQEFQSGESKITLMQLDVVLADGTTVLMTEEHVLMSGFTRDTSTTMDGEFTIGAAVTGKITVHIDNSSNTFSGYDFRGAKITAYLGGQLSNGDVEYTLVGTYTADEYEYDECNITLTAYDNFYKFNKQCSETDKTNPTTFSQTISQLVNKACSIAGVTLANESIPNGAYVVTKKPEAWDTMTWHDVIAYCAQIACCFATILPDGRLFFSWYNTSFFRGGQLDGGTFGTQTTPYYDGDTADGGDFTYGSTIDYDGGRFGDRDEAHYLGSLFSLTVDTDNVIITGVGVTLNPSNNINATEDTKDYEVVRGTNDYCIRIENNPFIETVENADFVANYVYDVIADMQFRPLNANVLENPAIEAGDIAVVTDNKNNAYVCFISHATYTTGASTYVSCDAASPMQNLKDRYSEADKTRSLIERSFQKTLISTDAVIDQIMSGYATTMGLNRFEDVDEQGRTIWTYGNGNTLSGSRIRWRFSAGAFSVSNNFGVTWNAAITPEGLAVFKEIYAVKVNADNILTGTLTVGGQNNGNGQIKVYDANGNLCGVIDNTGVDVLGVVMSYNAQNGYASKIRYGRMYFYYSENKYTYEDLKALGWSEAKGTLSAAKINNYTGFTAVTPDKFVSIGKQTGNGTQTTYFIVNVDAAELYSGHTERIMIPSGSIWLRNGNIGLTIGSINLDNGLINLNAGSVQLKTASATTYYTIRWRHYDNDNTFAYIGYSQSSSRIIIGHTDGLTTGLYIPDDLYVAGTRKHRVVSTEHYGDIGMQAFETATPHFADIGSGTVGEDGTITVFFDPVFEETIAKDAEYQVFITRTSEAETTWVDKQNGYFIVHGDSGATFDWMITGYQRDCASDRMPVIDPPDEYISNEPIVKEDTSAIEAVEEMVDQYNGSLEVLA